MFFCENLFFDSFVSAGKKYNVQSTVENAERTGKLGIQEGGISEPKTPRKE
jgi:hypothetical protein